MASHLLHHVPQDLVRRLLIIMIEDAVLHPAATPVLTWVMMALSKGEGLGLGSRVRKGCFRVRLHQLGSGTPPQH